jgi:DHA3 family macrolide efflux protein-like MFS transporter
MFILSPLRSRPIRLLWSGQVLSAVGDEVYKIALVWMAIRLSGKDAGFLAAVEAGSILTFGLLGGAWAERWQHRRLMIWVDLTRAAAVLSIPVIAYFTPLNLPILIAVAIVVSSLSAFFDPALQATLPELTDSPELLNASNGLMEATRRIARVMGPGFIGVLNLFVPLVHFFTINAASFVLSAVSIVLLGRHAPTPAVVEDDGKRQSPWQGLKRSFEQTAQNPLLRVMVLSCFLTWSLWSLCFSLGLALLVNETSPGNLSAYGFLICSYGVGNLSSNLVWGSLRIQKPQVTTFLGTLIIGTGFVAVALAPTVALQMAAAAFCGVGGPMEDLSFLNVLQNSYRGSDIARIFRLRMALAFGGIFTVFLISPLLFRLFSVSAVIGGCGAGLVCYAIFGLLRFGRSEHHTGRQHDRGENSDLLPKRRHG